MQDIILRPDQAQLKQGIYDAWNSGVTHALGVLPTGGGKSIIVSDIALDTSRMGEPQCIIAHRKELVGQMSMHIARRGIMHRIIGPDNVVSEITGEHRREFGRSFINPQSPTAVAGVDTLVSRKEELDKWARQIRRATIDEAHHVLRHNKWGTAIAMFPNALSLGVTASPSRADGMGLGIHCDGYYGAMIQGPTMRELINMGALCDYEIVIPESDFVIDETALGADGDFTSAKMREASKRSHIVGDVVVEYIKYAYGKRGVTFATDVETANEIAAQFNLWGVPAVAISAKTPSRTRAEYIRRFRSGQLMQLVNVDLFGEGFDLPAIEVVSMARPTASLAVYLQQFGRALRILAGKAYGLVIDHVSNWKRHGFPDKPRFWTLDRRQKRAKSTPDPEMIDLTRCTKCSRPYTRLSPFCPHCGYEPPLPEPGSRTLQQVDGVLRLLDRATIEEMQKAAQLASPGSMFAPRSAGQWATAGLQNRQMERIQAQDRLKEAVAWWFGRERAKGRSDEESERRFYLTMGMAPLEAFALPRADMEKISEIVEGWVR